MATKNLFAHGFSDPLETVRINTKGPFYGHEQAGHGAPGKGRRELNRAM